MLSDTAIPISTSAITHRRPVGYEHMDPRATPGGSAFEVMS